MITNPKPTRLIKSIKPKTMYTNIGPIYDDEPGRPPSLYMARAVDAETFKDKEKLKKKQSVILEARAKAEALAEYKKIKEHLDIHNEHLKNKKEKSLTNIITYKNRSGRKPSKPKRKSKSQRKKRSNTQKNKKSK